MPRNGSVTTVALVGGGFDPVTLHAVAGDSVAVTVQMAGQVASVVYLFVVPKPGPPIVLRTDPPAHKRDVPLNVAPRVIFSQPIDPASLTGGAVQLRIGGNAISAQLVFTNVEQTVAELIPTAPLAPNTDYQLVVTDGIRDRAGTPLSTAVTVSFSTATTTTTTSKPASVAAVEISPLAATIGTTSNIPLTATLKDSAGNVLTNRPVTWNSNQPAIAVVTSNGTVTGMAAGVAAITATSEGIIGTSTITVTASVTPPSGANQIAFVRDGEIYLVNADGTGLAQLTASGVGTNADPAWSPDGQRLAFSSNRADGQSWDIYTMNANGSNVVRQTRGGYNVQPAWSPDGRAITYTSLQNGSAGVFVVDVDGGGASRVVLNRPGYDAESSWSPDGTQIIYISDWRAYDFFMDVYVMNVDGTAPRSLLETPFFGSDTYYHSPMWSRAGDKIALAVCNGTFHAYCDEGAIGVMKTDGSGLTLIARGANNTYARPTWSPDGQRIAFSIFSCDACPPVIRSVRVDGSGEVGVVSNGYSPAWRP